MLLHIVSSGNQKCMTRAIALEKGGGPRIHDDVRALQRTRAQYAQVCTTQPLLSGTYIEWDMYAL